MQAGPEPAEVWKNSALPHRSLDLDHSWQGKIMLEIRSWEVREVRVLCFFLPPFRGIQATSRGEMNGKAVAVSACEAEGVLSAAAYQRRPIGGGKSGTAAVGRDRERQVAGRMVRGCGRRRPRRRRRRRRCSGRADGRGGRGK